MIAASNMLAQQRHHRQNKLWHREKKRAAAAVIKREKGEARREVERLPLSWTRKKVLHAMQGYHFHYRGLIRKTVTEIAAKVKLSERTVQRCLRELEENGLIECSNEVGRGKIRTYRVLRYVIKSAVENLRAALRRRREKVTETPSGKGDTRARGICDVIGNAVAGVKGSSRGGQWWGSWPPIWHSSAPALSGAGVRS